jgi:membrane-bound lytic murein transglycosylase C
MRRLIQTLILSVLIPSSPLLFAEATSGYTETTSEDPFDAFDRLLEDNFSSIDLTLDEQFEILNQAMEDGYQKLSEEVAESWGSNDVKLPTKTTWVDYSDDLTVRRMIDFELGTVSIERVIDVNDKVADIVGDITIANDELQTDSLADLAVKDTALKYAKEVLLDKGLEIIEPDPAKADPAPVLANLGHSVAPDLLEDVITQAMNLEEMANEMQSPKIAAGPAPPFAATVTPIANKKRKISIQIPLKANFKHLLANEYLATVASEAKKQNLPPSLLLAVMETESHFNPRARSAVPAYGLMQLVPRSGAMDAYQKVYGEKTLLGAEYLYQPDNNMELGAAYLHILHNRYLRHITDPDSLQFCAIAAYNTGAGNVAKSFTGKTNVRTAAKIINTMTPNEVYAYLQENLPYEETRHYIVKVTEAQKKYFAFDEIANDENLATPLSSDQTIKQTTDEKNSKEADLLRYVGMQQQSGSHL